jgi:hypothetical protein
MAREKSKKKAGSKNKLYDLLCKMGGHYREEAFEVLPALERMRAVE